MRIYKEAKINPPLVKAVPLEETLIFLSSNNKLYPVMSLYLSTKATQIGNDLIIKIREEFRKRVLMADKIIIIGVCLNEDDNHIWGSLKETRASLYYVNPDINLFENWVKLNRKTCNNYPIRKSFDDFVNNTTIKEIVK